jgi:hypothetical protein
MEADTRPQSLRDFQKIDLAEIRAIAKATETEEKVSLVKQIGRMLDSYLPKGRVLASAKR